MINGRTRSTSLDYFSRCADYFVWSGFLVDQPFQERLAEGMIRCYLVQDEVVGFCHQWPKGLVDEAQGETPLLARSALPVMEPADAPAYHSLKAKVENEWVPQMQQRLDLDTMALPAIWDADFLYGTKADSGEDTYVLSEINVCAVWPYPEAAADKVAETAITQIRAKMTHP